MKLTAEQQAAVSRFTTAVDRGPGQLVIAGHAGTGKTTVIKSLVGALGYRHTYAVCTPTGKAAHVLRTKGVEASTLHALLYYPRENDTTAVVDFVDNDESMPDVLIVDEASMLDVRMVQDLRARVPFVCYVGDHGQLEPIGDDPELMKRPDIVLKQIHRQAKGSAIIDFAHRVRRGRAPMTQGPEAKVVLRTPKDFHTFDVILCAFNKTRRQINRYVRRKRGYTSKLPEPGEQVICLRNNKEARVFNGMTGTVQDIDAERSRISVETDDGPRHHLSFLPRQFGQEKTLDEPALRRKYAPTLWDFGYALTCHKSQGSEWARVAVYDEVPSNGAVDRWRYTAATRASEQLVWITT